MMHAWTNAAQRRCQDAWAMVSSTSLLSLGGRLHGLVYSTTKCNLCGTYIHNDSK